MAVLLSWIILGQQADMHLQSQLSLLETASLIRFAESKPEFAYVFRHALMQEAAYTSTLRADRRILHKAVGEALEDLYADQLDGYAALLAYHFEVAQEWPRALQWLTRAADRAYAEFALPEARGLYRRALTSLAKLPAQPAIEFDLRLKVGLCTMLAGAGPEVITPEFERCLELATDASQHAAVHFRLGQLFHLFARNDLVAAEQHYAEALKLLSGANDPEQYVIVMAHLGYVYTYLSQPARAAEVLENALALARPLASPRPMAQTLIFISLAYLKLGREEAALEAAHHGLALAQSLRALQLIGMAHSFLADIYLARAEAGREKPEVALNHLREMQRFGHDYGDILLAAYGEDGLAQYAKLIGDREMEGRAWAAAAHIFRSAGLPRRAAYRTACYGRILLETGRVDAAEEVFAQVRRDYGSEVGRAECLMAAMYTLAKQADQAYVHLERGLRLASSIEESRQWVKELRGWVGAAWDALHARSDVAALLMQVDVGQPNTPQDIVG